MCPYFADMREALAAVEKAGKVWTIKHPIDKDTELMPLVRWQYRGLPEKDRHVFVFENVKDAKGRSYNIPVVVGLTGASRDVYAMGLQCKPEETNERWINALRNPVKPEIVKTGPVKEEVYKGSSLEESGGLEKFPNPISTPGFDPAPFITGLWFTKDPETSTPNIGVYRVMLKGKTKTGILCHPAQHIGFHWAKCKAKGIPLQAAIVLGCVPAVEMVGVAKVPYGLDECAVVGGLVGEPIKLVKCETVDVEVPATAEIVVEGEITTDYLEPEAPFGEYTGYMGMRVTQPVFNVKCITHRRNPMYRVLLSQMPPSEGITMILPAREALLYKYLKMDSGISAVTEVAFHEPTGGDKFCVIQLDKQHPSQVWQALSAASAYETWMGKIIIAVDKDINPRDMDSVNWALCYRMQPHRDIRIEMGKIGMLDPSTAPPGSPEEERLYPQPNGASALLIDATTKWEYPPISLPSREFMERAKILWEMLELPPLTPKTPWYGYSLGLWSKENEDEARLAVEGDYRKTVEKLEKQGKKI